MRAATGKVGNAWKLRQHQVPGQPEDADGSSDLTILGIVHHLARQAGCQILGGTSPAIFDGLTGGLDIGML